MASNGDSNSRPIHAFFKRKNPDGDAGTTDTPPTKKTPDVPKLSKTVTASLKTVKKWEWEMNITLEIKTRDDDPNTVTQLSCPTCKLYAKDKYSSFVTGNKVVKKESVQYHKNSSSHRAAVSAKTASQKIANDQPTEIELSFQKMDENIMVKMTYLFNTAFYLARKERPFTDFAQLIQLQKKNTLDLGETYCNDISCKQFTNEIADYYFDDLKALLKNADYFSIFTDGSTDRSQSEKEVIMVKLIEHYYPVMKFLRLEEPENTKATGILKAVDNAFSAFEMEDYHKKLVGYCSDGASVMMGSQKGVIKMLKDTKEAPWVLTVWCLAHRLELAVKDCFKNSYMDDVVEVLRFIYEFYKVSAKRNKEAEQIAIIMEEEFMKPEKVNGTRWIDHKLRATDKLLRNWPVIVAQMENYAEDKSNKDADRAKTKGILNKLLQYKFVWYLHFLKKLLGELAVVSLTFQREDISTSTAVEKLKATDIRIQQLMDGTGPGIADFKDDITVEDATYSYKNHKLRNYVIEETLDKQKNEILQTMVDCMHARFENVFKDKTFVACHAFDHKNWPSNEAALVDHGTDDVRHIYKHFQPVLENVNCNLDSALNEFTELKLHISRNTHYRGTPPLDVWQRVSQEDEGSGNYRNILKVIHLTGVYPLSNASCERSFSAMKRVKSDWRCRLRTDTLDRLLRIVLSGPTLDKFEAWPIVSRWWLSGQRIKKPSTMPYGPRTMPYGPRTSE